MNALQVDCTSSNVESSTHRDEIVPRTRGSASEPDVLVLGNSLTNGFNPGQLFAPFYTRVETLDNKTLDGTIEFLEGVQDIKPKVVVLHCLENNIGKESGVTVLRKLKSVLSKCNQAFPGVPVMVVEPIGRGKNKEQYKTVF